MIPPRMSPNGEPADRAGDPVIPISTARLMVVLPIHTMVIERPDGSTGVMRRWHDGDVERCDKCSRGCKAGRGDDGQWMCYVEVAGRIDPASAPTLRL